MNQPITNSGNVGNAAVAAKRRRPRRWIPYGGGALLLLALIVGLWPKPTPIEVAQVKQGPLRVTINEEGKTRIKQRFVVSAPVSGQLRRIAFKAGAEVQAGYTVVAVIDPLSPALLDARSRTQAEAKRDAARANLEKATSAHSFAASELKRFQKLFTDKVVSPQEFEPVQWREASTARDQAAAESALKQAEAELAVFSAAAEGQPMERTPTEIRAPANGQVLRVFEESARVVAPGTPLLEVGDPTDLEAVIEVLSRDGAVIAPGTKVEFEQWGGGQPLVGRVRLVEPAAFTKVSALGVEEQRVNVIADILTPPAERPTLGDAFRVEARIVVWSQDKVLKVPAGALFRRGDQWSVFLLEGGRARLRTVKVGHSNGIESELLEGLTSGQAVILYPGDRVQDSARVKEIRI